MTQPGLFDVGPPVKKRKPKTVSAVPSWTSNDTKAMCFDCIAQLAAGEFITAMRAQWRRTAGTDVALYCYAHATPRRDADHLAARRES